VVSAAVAIGRTRNADAAGVDARKLKDRIDTEVSNLATAHPEEAVKSPRFVKALKERFNMASASEMEVNHLRLALAPASATTSEPPAGCGKRI
jgi:hypothetical protein